MPDEDVGAGAAPSVQVGCEVCIAVAMELRVAALVADAQIGSASEVAHDAERRLVVGDRWAVEELGQAVDRLGEVGPGVDSQV